MLQARDEAELSTRLGALLYRLREAKGLTTRAAASLIGISHSRVVALEHGRDAHTGRPTLPSPELAIRIAATYGYPKEQLLLLAGHAPWQLTEEQAQKAIACLVQALQE
ncbi:Helix-turn-helix domain protein [compost metagenome]